MSVHVLPLHDRPDLLPAVAAWSFAQWGRLYPEDDEASWAASLRAHPRTDAIPLTLVAVDDDGRALGSASLVAEDIDGDLRTPWLASVYVHPEARGRHLGIALVAAIEAAAARLGVQRLWLFTPDRQGFYAGLDGGGSARLPRPAHHRDVEAPSRVAHRSRALPPAAR